MQFSKLSTLFLFALSLILFSSCGEDTTLGSGNSNDDEALYLSGLNGELKTVLDAQGGLEIFALPASNDYASIPQDPLNPLNSTKVELGRKLFFETGLAINPKNPEGEGTYSCASCHIPGACFQPSIRQGIGDGGQGLGVNGEGREMNPNYLETELDIQPIRTPSNLNVAYNRTTLWNGQFGAVGENEGTEAQWTEGTPKETNNLGYHGTEIQAIAGLKEHRMDLDPNFIASTYYKDMFDIAFPDFAESERYTRETAGLAIAAFERTVLSNQSPFQDWIKGNGNALTDSQKEGALLFFGKGGCADCHSGPALNNEKFFALGMNDLEGSDILGTFPNFEGVRKGRGGFTGNPADDYKFKTPQLYGLKAVSFLGHGASFENIREVIEYKNNAIAENNLVPSSQLDEKFIPLELNSAEIDALTDFVENALHDGNMARYEPNSVASGNCIPNNDPMSRADAGCD